MTQENPEFEKFKILFEQGKSVFLTGKAGTGKTTFIKQLINETDKNVVVVVSSPCLHVTKNK